MLTGQKGVFEEAVPSLELKRSRNTPVHIPDTRAGAGRGLLERVRSEWAGAKRSAHRA